MTDAADIAMGEVVDFPARPPAFGDDSTEFPGPRPGPSVDGAGDGGSDGPRRPTALVPDDDPDGPGDDGDEDRESVAEDRVIVGVPVDPPDHYRPRRAAKDRAPVIPPWLATRTALAASLVWAVKEVRYHLAFHAVRAPKYAAKTVVFAPVGAVRAAGRLTRWASAEEGNWHLRQAAADRGDADTWLKLDARRQRQARWRWPLVGAGTVVALAALVVLVFGPVPALARVAGLAVAVAVLARLGRPADKPITDRVSQGKTYRKLTAELVRRALLHIQLAGINSAVAKDPHAISFPVEIHRDGPGHLAIVDLPYGVEAADVIARRGRLASGLRLPLDQVWPEPAPGHTGRLALWVGHEPASQMRQPAWPLIRDGKVDVFKPFPFATTPRLDTTMAELMFRNWLFGGQPGSGKTFAIRDLDDGLALPSGGYTVADAVNDWLTYGLNGRAPGTVAKNRIYAEGHVIPALGVRKLRELTADDVDRWLAAESKYLSTDALGQLRSILRRSVGRAQARDKVKRNVVLLCDLPKGQPGRPSKSLTLDQAQAVLAAADAANVRMRAYITLSLLTGMRTEEVRGLIWPYVVAYDADRQAWVPIMEAGWEHSEFAVYVWRSERVTGDTKTRKSRRSLALPQRCVNALKALWEIRAEQQGSALVFVTRTGKALSAGNVRRDFRKVVDQAGLNGKDWTPREMRHSFVSLLSDSGMRLENISRLVGHQTTTVTETVYRHQLRPVIEHGASAMDHIFPAADDRQDGDDGTAGAPAPA